LRGKFIRYAVLVFSVFLVLLSFAFKIDFRLTGYLPHDMNLGNLDNFPIAYWTVTPPAPFDSVAIKFTDYLTYSHTTFKLFDYDFIVPRYYFVDTKLSVNIPYIQTIYLAAGRMRLSRGLTSQYESVSLGGLKFDTYNTSNTAPGLGGFAGYVYGKFGSYSYEIGGAYSTELSNFALYGTLTTDFGRFGAYYETRYYQVSLNYSIHKSSHLEPLITGLVSVQQPTQSMSQAFWLVPNSHPVLGLQLVSLFGLVRINTM